MDLDLSDSFLTESELIHVASQQNDLRGVTLSSAKGLSDRGCYSLLQRWKKLVYLDLSFCSNITDKAFEGMHDPHLQTLNLKGCDQVTDRGLLAISIGCPNLKSLYLAYCSQITDEGITAFHNSKITTLDLSRCHKITDNGIYFVIQQLHDLRSLNLLDTKISQDCRTEIQQLNPQLAVIS